MRKSQNQNNKVHNKLHRRSTKVYWVILLQSTSAESTQRQNYFHIKRERYFFVAIIKLNFPRSSIESWKRWRSCSTISNRCDPKSQIRRNVKLWNIFQAVSRRRRAMSKMFIYFFSRMLFCIVHHDNRIAAVVDERPMRCNCAILFIVDISRYCV